MDVIVVGGGASGLMAAYAAASSGKAVTIFERNEKCGKKIYITGKGRCNITNACDYEEFFNNIVTNSRFMYSAFYSLTNDMTMNLFEGELGLPLKVERGNRVFPVSDKASDVTAALLKELKRYSVRIEYNTCVKELIIEDNAVRGVVVDSGRRYMCDRVILAAGGCSYSSTGSDGRGYELVRMAGHTVTDIKPGLVPFETYEDWPVKLQGLTLKNVMTTFRCSDKIIYRQQGEVLFTHFGISGPLVISASSYIGREARAGGKYNRHIYDNASVTIDCKPALTEQMLEKRIIRDFAEKPNIQYKNSLGKLLPSRLADVVVRLSGIKEDKPVNSVTKEERRRLVHLIKNLDIRLKGTRGFNEAIVTQGGVNVKEVDSSTMESKLCKGLYITGELLDVDAVTGGYNLQIAWSTGYLAGISC